LLSLSGTIESPYQYNMGFKKQSIISEKSFGNVAIGITLK